MAPRGGDPGEVLLRKKLPETTSKKALVQLVKNRWWIEHSYKELKDELGPD